MVVPSSSATAGRAALTKRRGGGVGVCCNPFTFLLLCLGLCYLSFYMGTMWGFQACQVARTGCNCDGNGGGGEASPADLERAVAERVAAELKKSQYRKESWYRTQNAGPAKTCTFPSTMKTYATGAARVTKSAFTKMYDTGVPVDLPKDNSNPEDVLMLYSGTKSLPPALRNNDDPSGLPRLDPEAATANCDYLNVILTDHSPQRRQCVAVVPQYESYHVQRFMRVAPTGGALDSNMPLRYVSRGYQANGMQKFKPPTETNSKNHVESLRTYLNSLEDVLAVLGPIAKSIAVDNTIIVLTCNFGQSELLMNFVCLARARGFDIRNVLVFATDEETLDLARGLGVAAWYDRKNFERLPSKEAGRYGDKKFIAMMYAKVVCVQVVNLLGYDLLFQDVDVVWYQNPLTFFHDKNSPMKDFDVYFQDDGAHSVRYAPYSANSGFYYIRHNDRTRHFLTQLLYGADLILKTTSHQQALIAFMSDHASLYGLKVKVLDREMTEFPGGWHYHRRKDFMRQIVTGKVKPYIFHMSWTDNKVNKVKFFQQMGEWFLDEKCIGKTAKIILGGEPDSAVNTRLVQPCCSMQPLVKCHYRDKASKVPCKDSPPIDKGKPSFWP